MSPSTRGSRTLIEAASLVLGPLLMSVGDLLHPEEREDAAAQAVIIIDHASRWYAAHLLLFIGGLVFIPGILALTRLTAEHRPTAAYAGRILLLIGMGTLYAVFVFEMLVGRYVADGADLSAAKALLETFQSGRVLGAVMAGAATFFAGMAVVVLALVMAGGRLRWPALALGLAALLLLAEIITSEVVLSQIGNVVFLAASVAFAWHIVQGDRSAMAGSVP